MAPFRSPPRQGVPRPTDSDAIRKWFARRDQFAALGDRDLWPPAPTSPFDSAGIDAMAVSGDGKVALIHVDATSWLVDTQSLATRRMAASLGNTRAVTLSDDASRAVIVCGSTIYVWDLDDPGSLPERMWKSKPLSNTKFLSMSADGRTVAASASSQGADLRIFDLDRKSLTYSFTADADEGMQLHPGGRHIICFGDDGFARVFGSGGYQQKLGRNAGGAISRDGAWLLTNDLDSESSLSLYALDASEQKLKIGPVRKIAAGFAVGRWDARIRFSPSGSLALVRGADAQAYLVEIAGPERTLLAGEMTLSGAILHGETRAFLRPGNCGNQFPRDAVAVVEWSEGARQLGAISACLRNSGPALVGTSPLGFFGSLEEPPSALGKAPVEYYERPEMMPSILGGGSLEMSPDDELRAREVAERAAVWKPFLAHLTADIDHRQLMELNKGVTHLTPAIASRALDIDSDVVRFGASQLSWTALTTASAEIRAMPLVDQERIFDEMLDRLRAAEARDADVDSDHASKASSEAQALTVHAEPAVAKKQDSQILVSRILVLAAGPILATIVALVYLLFA